MAKGEGNDEGEVRFGGRVYRVVDGVLKIWRQSNLVSPAQLEGLDNLINLRELHLGINHMERIEGLERLGNLEVLDLSGNFITKIEGLDGLAKLRVLHLSSNHLAKIENLDALTRLEELGLGGAIPGDLDKKIKTIEGLDHLVTLKTLILPNNNITRIQGLENNVNLREIRLHGNKIEKIEGLDALARLEYLGLSHNRIGRIEGLERLVNLQVLGLGVNAIPRIEGLGTLVDLRELALNGNKIARIEGLEHLSRLETLDLRYNPIADPVEKALAEAMHLDYEWDTIEHFKKWVRSGFDFTSFEIDDRDRAAIQEYEEDAEEFKERCRRVLDHATQHLEHIEKAIQISKKNALSRKIG